jgi:hypothetical protein
MPQMTCSSGDWIEKTRGLDISSIETRPGRTPGEASLFVIHYQGEAGSEKPTRRKRRLRRTGSSGLNGHDISTLLTRELDEGGPS